MVLNTCSLFNLDGQIDDAMENTNDSMCKQMCTII